MKRIWTSLEVLISAGLLVLGLYMLSEGILNKSTNEAGIVIGGAACSALGAMSLISAVRFLLWHRRMLLQAMHGHDVDKAVSGQKQA